MLKLQAGDGALNVNVSESYLLSGINSKMCKINDEHYYNHDP